MYKQCKSVPSSAKILKSTSKFEESDLRHQGWTDRLSIAPRNIKIFSVEVKTQSTVVLLGSDSNNEMMHKKVLFVSQDSRLSFF